MTTTKKPCARCMRSGVRFAKAWPEGSICTRCYQRAMRIVGACAGCGTERLLPGLNDDGQPICVDCAGITEDLRCTRCGMEDEPVRVGLCAKCCLADDLEEILDDGSGHIAVHLRPVYEALTTQRHPRSARIWLTVNRPSTELLRDLATGRARLDHTTFTAHPTPSKVNHLRKLLTTLGLLEEHDPLIERYESWLAEKLPLIPELPDRLIISQFARFVHLNRMRHLAGQDKLKVGTLLSARQSTAVATDFLSFLRDRDKSPGTCAQDDIDAWLAGGPTTRSLARTFARWAVSNGHMPKVVFPYRVARTVPRIGQDERLSLLRRALEDNSIPTYDRAAIVLMMLFAQPLTRAVAMRMDQFLDAPEQPLRIAFTEDPVEVPEPFGNLLRQHLKSRPNMNTAANARSIWCFPGANPGEHANSQSVMQRLRTIGIDLRGAKNTTLQELVLQIPPSIAADALGYSYQVMDIHETRAGGRWKGYPGLRNGNS